MSNEIIPPFQQFFDFAGRPNANGQIEFFTDSGRLTQKDIFTTGALTVAQSNPYTLNDSGEIEGDVHYDGTATLVHTNAAGVEFRQDDVIASTSDGLTGAITKQEASVASMVANQALIIGDIVSTRGYHAPSHFGGANYVIVSGTTGIVDNYRFHQLGNGLRAQLLNIERHTDFLVAGARGNGGSDDTSPMQAVINLGGEIVVEGGFIFTASNLAIPLNVTFIGSGTMKQRNGSAGDFLQITSIDVTLVRFRGVTLDANQPNVDQNNSTLGWVL